MIVAARSGKFVAAMPANSCMPVSNDPPLFAVSVHKGAKTNQILKQSKNFSINWLNFSDRKIVKVLAEKNNSSDKLAALNIPYQEVWQAPVLIRAQAYAICKMKSVQVVGDHDLFIGSLMGGMASLDFDQNWKFDEYRPILYLGSGFRNPYTTLHSISSVKKIE